MNVGIADFKQQVLESNEPVLVDFWAEWCGPCRMFAPIIDELENDFKGRAKVCKVNVDENQSLAAEYGVMSIPTIVVFQNGKVVETLVGSRPKAELAAVLDRLLA